ncbi:peptidase M20 [Geodermatophilus sp. Leaf369]|uniref:ArgE/DapE family deacylase n=1 Tax=Geodermatophilus sp. Leaf369 TaxID=1736354 RepID=UPI0006F5D9B5|nr:ArgE/DapE family deacylase [Geodermatophilus sp. Leaf369]KQS60427.1 peptidase M20 [Geodermatophilus sp. Leaf369]
MSRLSEAETRVLDALDEVWLLDRLRELVAVPSVGGSAAESEAQHLVAGWLAAQGADVDCWPLDLVAAATAEDAPGQEVVRDEAWGVVGTLPGHEDGEPGLVLCGHTDVVPAGDPALWSGDPFAPRLVDGVLHGRGTCDMKGGLVAALAAARAVHTAGVQLVRPLAVHSVVGEEDGGLGAWAALNRGHRGAACVIPEPTAGAVMTASAGALTFRLTVTGLAAHGAMRDAGVSAVELFGLVHAALRELEAGRQDDVDRFLGTRLPYGISVGTVHAGDWSSTVPDRLVAEGRYGVRVGEPVETARTVFEAHLARFCAGHGWLAEHPVRVEWVGGSFASGQLAQGSALLPAVTRAAEDAGRARPVERALPAGTDLRLYAAAGIPTLHYGPGDLALAHAPQEQVPVDDVVHVARVLALTALRQCGVHSWA